MQKNGASENEIGEHYKDISMNTPPIKYPVWNGSPCYMSK